MFKIWTLVLGALITSSCASGPQLKDTCAATNWEDRARSYADQGKSLPDSEELRVCTAKVDAKYSQESEQGYADGKASYCSPERARARGIGSKNMDDMGVEFCGSEFAESFTRYQVEGQIVFCTPGNARVIALAGQVYQPGQCLPKSEARFLKSYNTARREYLREKIDKNNEYLKQLELDLSGLEKKRVDLSVDKPALSFTNSTNPNNQAANTQSKNVSGFPIANSNSGQIDMQNKNNTMETLDSRNRRENSALQESDLANKSQRLLRQQGQIRTQNGEYEAELKKLGSN